MSECMDEKNGCTVVKQYYGCCGGNGNSGTGVENVYSTEETVCGTWIDGKSIYRRVIKKSDFTSYTGSWTMEIIEGIDTVVDLRGEITAYNAIVKQELEMPVSFSSVKYGSNAYVNYNKTTGVVGISITMDSATTYPPEFYKAFVIIEYTKK